MIWFDLDNSPHVPLFVPVIRELERRGEKCYVTVRDFAQTVELCKMWGLEIKEIGKHGGKNRIKKVFNIYNRARQLQEDVKSKKIELAVSHGSRAQVIASKKAGIPSILMMDYEYTEKFIFNRYADKLIIPKYIPDEVLKKAGIRMKKVSRYNGFKEELYLNNFIPEENFREKIGVRDSDILIVIRPPSLVGNYRKKESEDLFIDVIKYLSSSEAKCLVINRTKEDLELMKDIIGKNKNVIFLKKVVDGLQLLYSADIVISGGGTMNRESALLGTKTYSIFKGRKPYLDEYLEREGKMKFINKIDDFKDIEIKKYEKKKINFKNKLVEEVTEIILRAIGE